MLYAVEYWCSARGCWLAASYEDGRPLEFESIDAAMAAARDVSSYRGRARIVDYSGRLIREFRGEFREPSQR